MSALSMAAKAGMKWTVWARVLIAAEVVLTLKRHFDLLDVDEKGDLQRLLRKSKGKPSNLTKRERQRVMAIVDKFEFGDIAKETAIAAAPWRRSK
jgi:hypothetical protein